MSRRYCARSFLRPGPGPKWALAPDPQPIQRVEVSDDKATLLIAARRRG